MIKKYNSQATKLEFKSFSKHQINLYKQLQLKHGKNYDPDFDQNFSCDHIFISNNFQFFALFVEYANYDDDEFSSNNESGFDDMKEYVIIAKTFTSINNCLYKEKSSNPQEGLFSPDSLYFAFLCKDGITIINLKNSQKILILESIENFLNASFDTDHNFYLATDNKLMIKSLKHNFIKNLDFDTGENEVDLYFQTKFLFKKFVIIKREKTLKYFRFMTMKGKKEIFHGNKNRLIMRSHFKYSNISFCSIMLKKINNFAFGIFQKEKLLGNTKENNQNF